MPLTCKCPIMLTWEAIKNSQSFLISIILHITQIRQSLIQYYNYYCFNKRLHQSLYWKVGLLGMSFMDMQPTVAYWSVFLFIGYVAVYVTTYSSIRWDSCYIFKRCSFDKYTAGMLNTVNLLLY